VIDHRVDSVECPAYAISSVAAKRAVGLPGANQLADAPDPGAKATPDLPQADLDHMPGPAMLRRKLPDRWR